MPDKIISNQNHPIKKINLIRCRNCGYERQITDQWLKEFSAKLSISSSIINESEIFQYSNKLRCSKCNERDALIISFSKTDPPKLNNNSELTEALGKKDPPKGTLYAETRRKELEEKAYWDAVIRKEELERRAYEVENKLKAALEKNREAYLAAMNRYKETTHQTGGIPVYEDGEPRSEWGTREDHKKMRGRDFGDMKRRLNE